MADVEVEDRSGELRPRSDFEEALQFIERRVVQFGAHPLDPEFMVQTMTIRQALKLAIKLWDQAEAKGLKRVSGP